MPPPFRIRSLGQLAELHRYKNPYTCSRCSYATVVATTPTPSEAQTYSSNPPLSRYSPDQPPSHRNPKYRKSQLIRSYVSLLQTTPLIILFQHNSLKAVEWTSIRRELTSALRNLDAQLFQQGTREEDLIGEYIKLQVIKTTMFEPALRITEYHKPNQQETLPKPVRIASEQHDPSLTHTLSESAYRSMKEHHGQHPLTPLLTGSLAILTFPRVSPQHIKTAFSILSPKAPHFPAPSRRANPSLYDPPVQEGLRKLMLLGARIDGQIFDMEGTRWVGSIDGGLDGLRAQLVGMLQGFGGSLAQTLESAGRSIWFTMESRRNMLEEEGQAKDKTSEQSAKK